MAKQAHKYEIAEAVRGSFIGQLGRVRYDVEPGIVGEADIDPEVLGVLIATGAAVKVVKAAKPAESEESA